MLNLHSPIEAVNMSLAVALGAIISEDREGAYATSTGDFAAALRALAAALERCSIARRSLRTHHDRLVSERGPYVGLTQALAELQDAVGVALVGPTPIDLNCVSMATRCATNIADALDLMEAAQLVAGKATTSENLFLVRYGQVQSVYPLRS